MPSDWYEVHTAFFDTNRKLDLPRNQRGGKAWGEKEEGEFHGRVEQGESLAVGVVGVMSCAGSDGGMV
jgi:hypothetical protein